MERSTMRSEFRFDNAGRKALKSPLLQAIAFASMIALVSCGGGGGGSGGGSGSGL